MTIQAKVLHPVIRARVVYHPAPAAEHPVVAAVRSHVLETIEAVMTEFPEHLEADFGGLLRHFISQL